MKQFILALWIFTLCLSSTRAALQVHETTGDDGIRRIAVEHPLYTLEIIPSENGRTHLTRTVFGTLHTSGKTSGGGLFREVFSEAQMDRPAVNLVFDVNIETPDPNRAVVTMTTTLGLEAGEDLDGVRLQRRLHIDAARPTIDVELEFFNPTESMRYVLFGVRNHFTLHRHGSDFYHLPTTLNVIEISRSGTVWAYYAQGGSWEYFPVEGWIGATDRERKSALVFMMDYNRLEALYASPRNKVLGWMMDGGELYPGQYFRTRYTCAPLKGFEKITYADTDMVADLQVDLRADHARLRHTLATFEPMDRLTVATTAVGVRSGAELTLDTVDFTDLGPVPQTRTVNYPNPVTEPMVFRIRAMRDDDLRAYEFMTEAGFRTQPIPGLAFDTEYKRPRPQQIRESVKPENLPEGFGAIQRERSAVLFFGIYTEHYRIDEVFDNGWELQSINCPPDRVESFPSASGIDRHGVIVLSDVSGDSLSGTQIRRLERYVRRGGNLIILGGPYAYGQGRYHELGLDELLPVESRFFDLVQRPGGVRMHTWNVSHPIVENLDFSVAPRLYWLHQCRIKDDAEVVVTAGDYDPVLVIGDHGAGKVACFLGTPLGDPPPGETPAWEWAQWPKLLNHTVEWMFNERNEQ